MNLKQFSDKMFAKVNHNEPYEKLGDPIPYRLFENLYHLVISDLEDNDLRTVWYQENKPHVRTIIKMVVAETLLGLAESNISLKSRNDRMIREQSENDDMRDSLVWQEILKILNYPVAK